MTTLVVLTVVDIVLLIAGLAFYLYWVGSLLTRIAGNLEECAGLVRTIVGNAKVIGPGVGHINQTGGVVAGALPLLYGMAEEIVDRRDPEARRARGPRGRPARVRHPPVPAARCGGVRPAALTSGTRERRLVLGHQRPGCGLSTAGAFCAQTRPGDRDPVGPGSVRTGAGLTGGRTGRGRGAPPAPSSAPSTRRSSGLPRRCRTAGRCSWGGRSRSARGRSARGARGCRRAPRTCRCRPSTSTRPGAPSRRPAGAGTGTAQRPGHRRGRRRRRRTAPASRPAPACTRSRTPRPRRGGVQPASTRGPSKG